jgi:hypothetical protein
MFKYVLPIVLTVLLSGCSLLPRVTFDKPGVTPTQTEKSSKKETCAGEYKVDEHGNMTSCTKGYNLSEQNYKQADRKFTLQEKIANFFRNLTGWGFPLVILACVFIPGFGGALLGFIINNVFGIASKGFKSLVEGIQSGKEYVRNNGDKYSPAEREIYLKGAKDMLDKIDEAVDDPAVDKTIAVMRADLKWK